MLVGGEKESREGSGNKRAGTEQVLLLEASFVGCFLMLVFILFLYMHMYVWVHVCASCAFRVPQRSNEGTWSPTLQFQAIVSIPVGAGNWTLLFCKGGASSCPLSHLSSPFLCPSHQLSSSPLSRILHACCHLLFDPNCLSVCPLRLNLISLIINVYRKSLRLSLWWVRRSPLCLFLKVILSLFAYKIINSRAEQHLGVQQLQLSVYWEIEAQRYWEEMSLVPSSSISSSFSTASWEESTWASQAGDGIPFHRQRGTSLSTHCAHCGNSWLSLLGVKQNGSCGWVDPSKG